MTIKIEKINDSVPTPIYQTPESAGFDLTVNNIKKIYNGINEINLPKNFIDYSMQRGYFYLRKNERVLLGTGIKIQLPKGKQLEIRSRSGTALKKGLVILNSPGTIDNDYRGEIGLIIQNTTKDKVRIDINERIAQGVIMDYYQYDFTEVDELNPTIRGTNGYGSTGTN